MAARNDARMPEWLRFLLLAAFLLVAAELALWLLLWTMSNVQ